MVVSDLTNGLLLFGEAGILAFERDVLTAEPGVLGKIAERLADIRSPEEWQTSSAPRPAAR